MARQPKKASKPAEEIDDEDGTKHVRLAIDLVTKLREIKRFREGKSKTKLTFQQILDPWVRPQIEREFEEIRERSEKVKKLLEGE